MAMTEAINFLYKHGDLTYSAAASAVKLLEGNGFKVIRVADTSEQAMRETEWRCFHCDETFTEKRSAGLHFGMDQCGDPACKIKMGAERSLVTALRRAEGELADAWAAIHNESTEAAKAYHSQQYRHQEQIRAAEELGYERGLADAVEERDAAVKALTNPFCVVFLDGRNEYGSHVLPSFPCSIDLEADRDLEGQEEAILVAAEALGFIAGEDHVWAEFKWVEPQIGDEGRVEFSGYWEFKRINVEMSRVFSTPSPAVVSVTAEVDHGQ